MKKLKDHLSAINSILDDCQIAYDEMTSKAEAIKDRMARKNSQLERNAWQVIELSEDEIPNLEKLINTYSQFKFEQFLLVKYANIYQVGTYDWLIYENIERKTQYFVSNSKIIVNLSTDPRFAHLKISSKNKNFSMDESIKLLRFVIKHKKYQNFI